MRQRLERYFERIWFDGQRVPVFLLALEAVFIALSALRRMAYRHGLLSRARTQSRVLVVGNVTVGGTGKTPVVDWVCRAALQRGVSVGIASRGYGRRSKGLREVIDGDQASEAGDEALLLRRRLGVPVVVAERRAAAVRSLAERGVALIVMDDGMQHYRVERDFEIAVVDASRGLGNGRRLPAGPLRESPDRLQDCDLVLRNGAPDSLQVAGDEAVRIDGAQRMALAALSQKRWVALAGIGNPSRFFKTLANAGLEFEERIYGDHHEYRREEIADLMERSVITTEKDAVKLSGLAGADWWYVPVMAHVAREAEDILQNWLRKHFS